MTITHQQVRDTLLQVCAEQPDKTNPVGFNNDGDSVCLYLDQHGNRCIGGEIVFRLTNVQIPADCFAAISTLLRQPDDVRRDGFFVVGVPFEIAACNLLQETQLAADRMNGATPEPMPWGEIPDELRLL